MCYSQTSFLTNANVSNLINTIINLVCIMLYNDVYNFTEMWINVYLQIGFSGWGDTITLPIWKK